RAVRRCRPCDDYGSHARQQRLAGAFTEDIITYLARSREHRVIPSFPTRRSSDLGLGGKSAADKGKDTRDYLAAAFPELNAWERAGADASSAGMVDAGFENQKELTKMQLDNQKEIAEMQNETQKEIAG